MMSLSQSYHEQLNTVITEYKEKLEATKQEIAENEKKGNFGNYNASCYGEKTHYEIIIANLEYQKKCKNLNENKK